MSELEARQSSVVMVLPGGAERATTLGVGQRVVSAGYKLGLEDLGFGDCGGNCTCGTCHVRVKEGMFAEAAGEEVVVLETFPKLYADSRLACQLMVRADTGNVRVEWVG